MADIWFGSHLRNAYHPSGCNFSSIKKKRIALDDHLDFFSAFIFYDFTEETIIDKAAQRARIDMTGIDRTITDPLLRLGSFFN